MALPQPRPLGAYITSLHGDPGNRSQHPSVMATGREAQEIHSRQMKGAVCFPSSLFPAPTALCDLVSPPARKAFSIMKIPSATDLCKFFNTFIHFF